jgi:hypothetical protein
VQNLIIICPIKSIPKQFIFNWPFKVTILDKTKPPAPNQDPQALNRTKSSTQNKALQASYTTVISNLSFPSKKRALIAGNIKFF